MKKLGITFLSIFTAVNTWAAEEVIGDIKMKNLQNIGLH